MKNAVIAAAGCWLITVTCVAMADPVAGESKADLCLLCHRAGESKYSDAPILDGQPVTYFIAQIAAYKTGKRTDYPPVMNTNAASLSASDVQDLAELFAIRRSGPYPIFEPEKASSGMKTLSQLPCRSCHGSDYSGNGPVARLAGQNPRYTAGQLRSLRSGKRLHPTSDGGDAVKTLTDDDINNVAHAFASLK